MGKKSSRKPPKAAVDASHLDGIAGTKNRTLNLRLINEALSTLWLPEGISEEDKTTRVGAAIMLLKGIKPEGEIEGMLTTQMVGTHSAAMECLRRAMLPNQTFEGREQNLKHAAKLLSIFTGQIDALNKNRGKGQQKVTVEHIHVEAGANAVVGNVQTMPTPESDPNQKVAALAHAPGHTLDLKATQRARVKQPR